MLKYFIPSFLYCLYNNLTFVNLSSYDPTTYFLLLQFRVVITGVIFQMLFDKRLTRHQWLSLILLTVGCIIKQINYSSTNSSSSSTEFEISTYINFSLFLVLLQVLCSCFAGVYNEYILKEKDNQVIFIFHRLMTLTNRNYATNIIIDLYKFFSFMYWFLCKNNG